MSFLNSFLDWSHASLLENEEAQEYFRSRGVSSNQWERHKLGYIPVDFSVDPHLDKGHNDLCGKREKKGSWCDSCRYANWSASWIKSENGVKIPVQGRRIVGNIVLPLTNYAGGIVGFQIRSITGKSYDTFVLKHRPEGYFFGIAQSMQQIWTSHEVWIVEGPFDQLILERLVTNNVIAITTSAPGKEQTRFLRRFVRTVNSCLDRDTAGRKGFRSFVKWNSDHFTIRDIEYPRVNTKDKDLGDFWKSVGDDRFQSHFKNNVISTF